MRPTRELTFIKMATVLAERSTCLRRKVGCILTDKDGHVLATGYNGVPRGMPHCIERPCGGHEHESGVGLEDCQAIHAEQNALLQCPDTRLIHTVYVTTAPCMTCTKLFANTGARRIIYANPYPNQHLCEKFWIESERLGDRQWIYHPIVRELEIKPGNVHQMELALDPPLVIT